MDYACIDRTLTNRTGTEPCTVGAGEPQLEQRYLVLCRPLVRVNGGAFQFLHYAKTVDNQRRRTKWAKEERFWLSLSAWQ
jgi:hypothetical protein